LIVVGQINIPNLEKKIGLLFEGWPKGQDVESDLGPFRMTDSLQITLVNRPEAASTEFVIGIPAAPVGSKDYPALRLLDYILGGAGEVSRLHKSLVQKRRLATKISSRLHWWENEGLFTISGIAANDMAYDAIEEALIIIENVKVMRISAAELNDARSFQYNVHNRATETAVNTANTLGTLLGTNSGLDYLDRLYEKLEETDPKTIKSVALKYFDRNRMHIVVIGPSFKLKKRLSEMGRVNLIDPGRE
jgi:predicted Zn-dependent peptidase